MLFGIFFIFMQNFSFTYAVYMLFGRVFPMKRMKIVFQKWCRFRTIFVLLHNYGSK